MSLSSPMLKVKKGTKEKHQNSSAQAFVPDSDNEIFIKAKSEMERLEQILVEELSKHFSLQVDLRVYEDILVKLDDGSEKRMNILGRVSLKNAHMVMINFSDNPAAIKNAKLAIQKSALNVNPQHEGVVLYMPVPRMTRERREKLAESAKLSIYNDYKTALNAVYVKGDKTSTKTSKSIDVAQSIRNNLLALKKVMETKGLAHVETKQKSLLSEVA
uniref:RRF domain-containing protein n=1 Tax=Rhabditophanes sp. KR3021 TaxID=114890 RepID=A0AC35TMA2_9BILA